MLSLVWNDLLQHSSNAQGIEGTNVEIEARITNYLMRQGDVGLYKDTFNSLRDRAMKRYGKVDVQETSEFVLNGKGRQKIVRRGDKAYLAVKNNSGIINLPEYRLKISIELEDPEIELDKDRIAKLIEGGLKYVRKKKRYSYPMGSHCRLDMTISSENKIGGQPRTVYSVELELLDPNELKEFETQLTNLYKMTYGTHWVYQEGFLKILLSNVNKSLDGGPGNGIDPSVVPKIRNLKIDDLQDGGITRCLVSIKTEGDRCFLVLTDTVLCIVTPRYSVDVLTELSSIDIVEYIRSINSSDFRPSDRKVQKINYESIVAIFDGDLVDGQYFMISDLIYTRDLSLPRGHSLRMKISQEIKDMIELPDNVNVSIRTMSTYVIGTPEQFFSTCKDLLSREYEYPTHGLLFRPKDYYPEDILGKNTLKVALTDRNLKNTLELARWKKEDKLTIDLKYVKGDTITLYTYQDGEYGSVDIEFKGSQLHPFDPKYSLDYEALEQYNSDTIIEFVRGTKVLTIDSSTDISSLPHPYSVKKDSNGVTMELVMLVPLRTRIDKVKPNRIDYAIDNWDLMFSFLSRDDIEGRGTKFFDRAYSNMTQSLSDSMSLNGILLNINAGGISNISNWDKYSRVITIEPNPTNMRELKRLLGLKGLSNRVKVIQGQLDSKGISEIKMELRSTYPSSIIINGTLDGSAMLDNVDKIMGPNTLLGFISIEGTAVQELPSIALTRIRNEPKGKVFIDNVLDSLSLVEIKRTLGMRDRFMSVDDKILSSLYSTSILRKKADEEYMFDDGDIQIPWWNKLVDQETMELPKFADSLIVREDVAPTDYAKLRKVYTSKLSSHATQGLSVTSPRKQLGLKMCPQKVNTGLSVLNPGEVSPIEIEGVEGTFYRIGTIADGNCLIHAVLMASSTDYNDGDTDEKKLMAIEVRKELAEGAKYMVTKDGRSLVSILPYALMIESPDEGSLELRMGLRSERVEPMGYENVLKKVQKSGQWLGTEISAILPEALGVSIVNFDVRDRRARKVQVYTGTEPSLYYVAILNTGGHYEVIAELKDGTVSTVFDRFSPIVD